MKQSCMKDLNAVLSPLKVSGSLICTIGVLVAGAIVMVAGAAGCFEVLIFGFGADCLGCFFFAVICLIFATAGSD